LWIFCFPRDFDAELEPDFDDELDRDFFAEPERDFDAAFLAIHFLLCPGRMCTTAI